MWRTDARRGATALLLAGAVAGSAVPALAAGPGLPRTYDVKRIDSPEPIEGGAFGWGVASADLTGDRKADLLVAQAQTGKGQIFIFDGVTGAHIDTIDPPEKNPPNANGTPANNETLAFVYVETMPDLGSCPGGDGADADEICDAALVGAGDGIPEILAGSRNLRVNATDGDLTPTSADNNVGRAYVFDGATRAVLKRIDMPAADRQLQASFTGPTVAAQFGRLVMSLQGMAPCAGSSGENNAVGVGPCPDLKSGDRIGDVDGDGVADLIVTARTFTEPGAGTPTGSDCRTANAARCPSGKAWVYPGGQIAGTDPRLRLETPLYGVTNPLPQRGSMEFGGNVFRVGDIGGGADNVPDDKPEFVVAARNADYPLRTPDPAYEDVGAAFLFNGATGALMRTITSPEPQPRSQFAGSFNAGRPVGDVGATTNPDVLLPAPLQNVQSTDDGAAWVFNGITGGGGATGSWQFSRLTDPTPMIGGNFGGATTGVGDLVSGPDAPANEVLVAGFGPFDPSTEASNNIVTDLHIMNPTTQQNLQTIPHPDGARGDGFGVGVTPMGDLNGDGFLDFAASAYLANVDLAGQGRAYIFTSNNTPLPEPPPPPASPPAPAAAPTPVPTPAPLAVGPCANELVGSMTGEHLIGTLGGDNIFGLEGDDFINGFQGDDCIDGGPGRDRLDGGPDADKLFGGTGSDRLNGRDGRDRLYGMSGGDNLVGGYGHDLLSGGSGNDRLYGNGDRDKLYGESGRDRLVGGAGRDLLDGGSGNDSIEARDGQRDTILCGRGRDVVRADAVDSVNGCERVMRSRRR